jgi:hypothetical protein
MYGPPREDAGSQVLDDPDGREVLLRLSELQTGTPLHLASAVQLPPERVQEILASLERAGLAERTGPTLEPLSGVYYLSVTGVRAARAMRSYKKGY